ncbi:hypothetical protein [Tenacibaculum finnmarkense]|uniref:hypothetical protein n=1 Tax=Tenacibaculum finnmarkense TaxID=2781243 RepID=UPI00187B4352|nr:hypothetical protein [Tenacibaculum finnmarkense]MBE7661511.1 hypothetical protein [Tenacibaculum finnmarkense genomovar finnmarkense]MCG8253220.1 hypothetical protein [Tenacibaculum finnmarkense genomovar finnmarkense]MCG8816724.1 hypothetical protein [Tenacibaculum finnmarkense]MCG8821720.1 hypothetical protein [Tenacibaculum finnmarkense]
MDIKKHIIKKINDLVIAFPFMKVSYEVDSYSSSNYIKVLPSDSFYNDKGYQKFETELIMEFIGKFPNDEVVFVSDNCLIDVVNPIYEIEGELYKRNNFSFNTKTWSNNIELDFNLTLNNSVSEITGSYNSLNDTISQLNNNSIREIKEKPIIIKQEEESFFALAA